MKTQNFVAQLIARTRHLNKDAYIYQNNSTSYQELFSRSGALARYLKQMGVGVGDKVVLALYDTPAFPISFLAALWIGAIPIPLNPKSRNALAAHVLEDCDARLVIAEADNIAMFSTLCTNRLHCNILLQDVYNCCSNAVLTEHHLSDAMTLTPLTNEFNGQPTGVDYMQYTSGTTGNAKGVMHLCAGMIANTELYASSILGINRDSRIYSTAKMFFGYGLGASLFFTLWNNATAYLDSQWPNKTLLQNNLSRFDISHFFSVPAIYSLLDEDGETPFKGKPTLISAGSTLPGPVFSSWKNRHDLEILDGIGATETGHIFISNRPLQSKMNITGKVVSGYDVRLENVAGEDFSSTGNQSGVLWVKGPSISAGYHNLDKKTAENFKDGWYRTGDIFEKARDEEYKYIGRNDDVFKVKGQWVAALDLEHALLSKFPSAEGFLVLPKKDKKGLEYPCLVVGGERMLHAKQEVADYIFEHIQDFFPRHMVPEEIYFVQELPKNDNGKVLRRSLVAQLNDGQGFSSCLSRRAAELA
jgi:anthranilate-CoA ligase